MINLDFYKNKKIFITGHTGFKGTWLTRILLNVGSYIVGYALPPPEKEQSLFEQTNTQFEIQSVIDDVRNKDNIIKAVKDTKPDIIFHLAAQPLVRYSYDFPAETYETNVMGTVNILESVRHCSSVQSFINITTDKVYENKEWHWGYRENENLCGFDPYSNSKSCSELVTHSYKNSFFNAERSPAISTARSGNVIGGGDYAKDRIIPDCIRDTHNNKTIIIRNPYSIRPYQHVLECLNGYLILAQKQYENKTYSGAYNFGPNDEDCIQTGELASLFCTHWKENTKWVQQGDNGPHEATFLKLDCTKAKTILKWKPQWNIEMAVKKTVEWQKAVDSKIPPAEITDKQIKEYFGE